MEQVYSYNPEPAPGLDSQATEPNNYLHAGKPLKKLQLSRKTAKIFFSASHRKNFSLNLHYSEILFGRVGITLLHRQVIKCLNQKK